MSNWFVRAFFNSIGPRACAAAVIRRHGNILLTRRSLPLIEGGKWCLPGGKIKFGERAEEGLRRELKEEIGFNVRKAKFLFYHDEFVPRLKLHALVLVFLVDIAGDARLNWEVSELKWFGRKEIEKLDMAFTHKDILIKFFKMQK